MNHLDIDVLIATAALLCPPPPHQLKDGMNQVLFKSLKNRLQLPAEPELRPKENLGGGYVVVWVRWTYWIKCLGSARVAHRRIFVHGG